MPRCSVVSFATNVLPRLLRNILLSAAVILNIACETSVRLVSRGEEKHLRPPARILVYEFAITGAEVIEYQGIMRQQPSIRDPVERQNQTARLAGEALAVHLTHGLRQLGFTVERASPGGPAGEDDLVIDGRFVIVDEGNPVRRLVFGFGAGAATMETRVQVIAASQRHKLLEFATRANSAAMPGAVVTVPVAAMVPAGLSAGLTAGSAVATGLTHNSSHVVRMAAASADEAVRYLSEFFAKLGWIKTGQLKKARIAY